MRHSGARGGGSLVLWLRAPADPRRAVLGLMALSYLWLLAMTILVDGQESQRMRWHLEGVFLVMAGCGGRAVWQRWKPKKSDLS